MLPLSFSTARTARYMSLGEPSPAIQHVWFCLHGEAQPLAEFTAHLVNLDTPERLLILPEALSRYSLPLTEPGAAANTAACWFTPDSIEADLADHAAYLDALAAQVLAQCPTGVQVTVFGCGHGAAAAASWLAAGRTAYDRLILYASVFPPELNRQATLALLPKQPVTLVATTTDSFTPEATAEGLLHDLHEAGLAAQLRYVSEGPLPLASLGAAAEL